MLNALAQEIRIEARRCSSMPILQSLYRDCAPPRHLSLYLCIHLAGHRLRCVNTPRMAFGTLPDIGQLIDKTKNGE